MLGHRCRFLCPLQEKTDGERAPRVAQRLHSPCRGKGRAGAGLPKPISPAHPNLVPGDAPAVASQLAGFCGFSPLRTFQRLVMTVAEHKQGSGILIWGTLAGHSEAVLPQCWGWDGEVTKLCTWDRNTTRADP